MRTFSILPILSVVLSISVCTGSEDLSGTWNTTTVFFGTPQYTRMTLRVDGTKVNGSIAGMLLDGSILNGVVQLRATRSDGSVYGTFTGLLRAREISGEIIRPDGPPVPWKAELCMERRNSPRTHTFNPKQFHRYFSAVPPPVVRVSPGDTVRTKTVDTNGYDERLVQQAVAGNPLTGPFYVEGAFPGDTLIVHFTRLRLNRDSAVSGNSFVGGVVTPYYFRDTKPAEDFDGQWILDRAAGVAVPKHPTKHLKNLKIPLSPMVGCVGVAPPGDQAYQAGSSGSFGGNLDYNGLREGVTVYLPVYHPGALLYVGDAHAAQGDGEVAGDALETSMDLEFTVNLRSGKALNSPRAEDSDHLMAMGIAGSVSDAIQRATSALAKWIQEDQGLDAAEVAVLLGPTIRYDIAALPNPLVNVVAKIRKSVLFQIDTGSSARE